LVFSSQLLTNIMTMQHKAIVKGSLLKIAFFMGLF
jgi:hypothetical protein